MPVDAFRGDRDLRHEVSARERDAFRRVAAQPDAANDPILIVDPLRIEEGTELLSLGIAGDGRRQPDSKPFRPGALDALPCARPCARPAPAGVPLERKADGAC